MANCIISTAAWGTEWRELTTAQIFHFLDWLATWFFNWPLLFVCIFLWSRSPVHEQSWCQAVNKHSKQIKLSLSQRASNVSAVLHNPQYQQMWLTSPFLQFLGVCALPGGRYPYCSLQRSLPGSPSGWAKHNTSHHPLQKSSQTAPLVARHVYQVCKNDGSKYSTCWNGPYRGEGNGMASLGRKVRQKFPEINLLS